MKHFMCLLFYFNSFNYFEIDDWYELYWNIMNLLNTFYQYNVFELRELKYIVHALDFTVCSRSLDRLWFLDNSCFGLKSLDELCFLYNLCFIYECIYLFNNSVRLVVDRIVIIKIMQLINWNKIGLIGMWIQKL